MADNKYNPKQTLIEQYSSALVIGLGLTGYSVVRYLLAQGLKVQVLDSRAMPPLAEKLNKEYPHIECHFGPFDTAEKEQVSLVVVSPGVDLKQPFFQKVKTQGAHIVGDIQLFVEQNTQPLIAITGSNGKSTVTTLVGAICDSAGMNSLVAGNIGLPVLDALTDNVNYDIAILELSSFQLETTSNLQADAAAILNISPDHMDRYSSMGDYVLAKSRILRGAKTVVLPRHDNQLRQISYSGELLSFDLDEPANDSEFGVRQTTNYRWLMQANQKYMRLSQIPLTGLHNIKNVLAAFALVAFLKLPLEKLVSAVKSFRGLPHRMQTVLIENDVTWVNDSKATNIGATSSALKNLKENIIWIAGGEGKGADFNELKDAITDKIKLLIVLGEDADKIELALKGLLPIKRVESMQEAVQLALKSALKGSIVLLSPACASLDMYENFERRGDDFAYQVKQCVTRGAA